MKITVQRTEYKEHVFDFGSLDLSYQDQDDIINDYDWHNSPIIYATETDDISDRRRTNE